MIFKKHFFIIAITMLCVSQNTQAILENIAFGLVRISHKFNGNIFKFVKLSSMLNRRIVHHFNPSADLDPHYDDTKPDTTNRNTHQHVVNKQEEFQLDLKNLRKLYYKKSKENKGLKKIIKHNDSLVKELQKSFSKYATNPDTKQKTNNGDGGETNRTYKLTNNLNSSSNNNPTSLTSDLLKVMKLTEELFDLNNDSLKKNIERTEELKRRTKKLNDIRKVLGMKINKENLYLYTEKITDMANEYFDIFAKFHEKLRSYDKLVSKKCHIDRKKIKQIEKVAKEVNNN